jgi:hypothetical protein
VRVHMAKLLIYPLDYLGFFIFSSLDIGVVDPDP